MSNSDDVPDMGFGIPSLDALFGNRVRMVMSPKDSLSPSTSICLAGRAGTGKSILALHFAATYRADHSPSKSKIIYISTDFSHAKAQKVWEDFSLGHPENRVHPFPGNLGNRNIFSSNMTFVPLHCPAEKLAYTQGCPIEEFVHYLWKDEISNDILFIDLNSSRNGDEWDFVNRLIAILPPPKKGEPRHLLIVDAVEGLEMFVGSRDPHGEERTRRSRVTQLLRSASGKAHVFFVVEDDGSGAAPPEEFLTDFLLRTHLTCMRGYDRRMIEVVKARAQWHFRGQHIYVIRNGRGSLVCPNGSDFNPDDPSHPPQHNKPVGYVHVMHSLHGLYRETMRPMTDDPPNGQPTIDSTPPNNASNIPKLDQEKVVPGGIGFGIPFLDELIGFDPNRPPVKANDFGLIAGEVTALIGDSGTHKRRLGRAFLAGCFDPNQLQGVGVLLTISELSPKYLAKSICKHLPKSKRDQLNTEQIENRLVVRKLELHDISSAVFAHIVRSAVEEAERKLKDGVYPVQSNAEYPFGPQRIRMVIDDWTTLAAAFPDLGADPLVLPFMIDLLRVRGVTTLLIDGQPGSPRTAVAEKQHRDLRALTRYHIFTWRVPFFGEERIAISAVPAISDRYPILARELRPANRYDGESLWVDPHFEFYSGMEKSEPKPVPLQLRLYAKTDPFERYAESLRTLFSEPFAPPVGESFVVCNASNEYEELRHFAHVQSDSRLEHTLVFEVDEFWMQRVGRTELLSLEKYLKAVTDEEGIANRSGNESESLPAINDPFHVFRGKVKRSSDTSENQQRRRYEYFTRRGYSWKEYCPSGEDKPRVPLDRVPFMWDFGFLLLDKAAWGARRDSLEFSSKPISWRVFFEMCRDVAKASSKAGAAARAPFDLDLRASEALSCLVLEVWFSEILSTPSNNNHILNYSDRNPRQKDSRKELIQLMSDYKIELYRSLLLLGEALDASRFDVGGNLTPRPAMTDAVASRHWYSTATTFGDATPNIAWIPCRLPGSFSVRGDWHLAIARGSRSERLGWHAIDLLSSRRENVRRLRLGLGLPTRDYLPDCKGVDQSGNLISALKIPENGGSRPLRYGEIISRLGANDKVEINCNREFHWLFRSAIRRYSMHSRVWSRWLSRVLTQWAVWRKDDDDECGFRTYDLVKDNVSPSTSSQQRFENELAYAEAALTSASHSP